MNNSKISLSLSFFISPMGPTEGSARVFNSATPIGKDCISEKYLIVNGHRSVGRKPSVHQMVVTLEKKGLIEKAPCEARSIRLLLPREQLPDLE